MKKLSMQIQGITQEIQDVILAYFFNDDEEPKYENLYGSSLMLELIQYSKKEKDPANGKKVFKLYVCDREIIKKTLKQSRITLLWRSLKKEMEEGINKIIDNFDNYTYNEEKLIEIVIEHLPELEESELGINFSASGLIYQAWKEGKFVNLDNKENRNVIIDGLFFTHKVIKKIWQRKKNFGLAKISFPNKNEVMLLAMAEALGIEILEKQEDKIIKNYFSDGTEWIYSYDQVDRLELEFLEFGVIHRVNPQEIVYIEQEQLEHCEEENYEGKHLYLVSYPIIIDNYWFLGFAWFFQVGDPGKAEAEAYKKEKYGKLLRVVNTVAESLKLSLREKIITDIDWTLSFDQIFGEVARNYFTCLEARKASDKPMSDLDGCLLETYKGFNFYVPQQIWNSCGQSCAKSFKQELEDLELYLRKIYAIRTIGESKEKKRYLASVAHETKKLVSIIGDDDVAQPLRALIREYFMVVFSTMSSNAEDGISIQDIKDFPKEFAKGENLYEFIENQLYLSTRLNTLIENSRQGYIYSTKENLNKIFYEEPKRKSEELLVADEKLRDKKMSGYSKKYFFASALVAALNNILKHQEKNSQIEFSLCKEVLYIRNKRETSNKRKTSKLPHNKQGGTKQVLELYLEKYIPDAEPESVIFQIDNKDENYWITGLPCI